MVKKSKHLTKTIRHIKDRSEARKNLALLFTSLVRLKHKKALKISVLFKCSRGRIRTDDQLINSQLRYRCATRECVFNI